MTSVGEGTGLLLPYVPRLVVDWLDREPGTEQRTVDGTLVFADISGFTALTERLSRRGKAGAEEMGDALNATFDHLLADAYDHGAGLLKWGGDAVLLAFDGDEHASRAARASSMMQRTIARVGRLRTSAGPVQLGMSIGVHTGPIQLFLPHTPTRELLVVGPSATAVTRMEKYAERGQVVVSRTTAAALRVESGATCHRSVGPGLLLEVLPEIRSRSSASAPIAAGSVDLRRAVEPTLAAHVLDGPVAPEHRHIAIGFLRFAGVDALLEQDGGDAALDALRALLERTQAATSNHGVTLLSTDVDADGGKLIIVSGAPTATGDDEARVIAAVRDVMAVGGPLSLRAGINHGRVFAGDYGPAYRRVYSVAGDCVNLAARLMGAADVGQIRTLRSVLDRSRTAYAAVELPPFAAKGKSEPVRSWAVGEPRAGGSPASEVARRAPLVGREAELAVLVEEASSARSEGRVVTITAARGMGKSRLVDEFLLRSPFKVLRMTGEPYSVATPYAPWRRVMRHALDLTLDDPPDRVAEELSRHGERREDVARWLPLVATVAGVELPQTREVAALDPRFRRERLEEETVSWLSRNLPGPVVLVFEDPHLMDRASISLLQRFIDDASERTWLVVVVHPEEVDPGLAMPNGLRLRLPPIADDAALALLHRARAGRTVAPHRLDAIVRRAGGNPLFLAEMVEAVVSGTEIEDLPAGVEQLAAAHIDRLPPRERRIARAAAVLGSRVEPDLLNEVLGFEVDPAGLRGVVVVGHDGCLEFVHPVLREAAYEGLPFGRRRDLHARAAASISRRLGAGADEAAAVLSEHHLAAHEWDAAWATAMRAGERAQRGDALQEALVLFERALRAAQGGARVTRQARLAVEITVGDVAYALGDFSAAEAAFRRARRMLLADSDRHPVVEHDTADTVEGWEGEPAEGVADQLVDLGLRSARIAERRGRLRTALAWLTRTEQLLEGREDIASTARRARLAARRAWIRYLQDRPAAALQAAVAAEQWAVAVADAPSWALALRVRDLVDIDRGTLDGVPYGERALLLLDPAVDRAEIAHTRGTLGARAYFSGDWVVAAEHYAAAEVAYGTVGDRWQAALMQANRAEVLIDQGQTSKAAALVERVLPVWESAGQPAEVAFGRMLLGRAALGEGHLDRAQHELLEAHRLFVSVGEPGSARQVDVLLAEVRLRSGDVSEALRTAEEIGERMGESDPSASALARVQGEILAVLGRRAEAQAALVDAVGLARARRAIHEVAWSLDALERHGFELDEAARAERDAICARLGIVLQAAPAAAG